MVAGIGEHPLAFSRLGVDLPLTDLDVAPNRWPTSHSSSSARVIGFAVGAQFWYGTTLVQVVRVAGPDELLVRHLAVKC